MRCDRFDPPTKSRSALPASLRRASEYTVEYDLTEAKSFNFNTLIQVNSQQESQQTVFDERALLTLALNYVQDSPLAHALTRFIRGTGWKLSFADLGYSGFHMDEEAKEIMLDHFEMEPAAIKNSKHFKMSLIYTLVKALRDIWHEEHWDVVKEDYCPEALLQLERARGADGDSVAVLIAWELRGAGKEDLWRYVLSTEESDMAQVLVNLLERYPTALYNGMALAHIFRQWYADESRINAHDHMTLEYFDMAMMGGDDIFGDRKATAKTFEKLTLLPDGISYLSQLGDTVAKDPFFAGLDDPVNQAHLFQIIYDNKITLVKDIPFRDASLARRFMD